MRLRAGQAAHQTNKRVVQSGVRSTPLCEVLTHDCLWSILTQLTNYFSWNLSFKQQHEKFKPLERVGFVGLREKLISEQTRQYNEKQIFVVFSWIWTRTRILSLVAFRHAFPPKSSHFSLRFWDCEVLREKWRIRCTSMSFCDPGLKHVRVYQDRL